MLSDKDEECTMDELSNNPTGEMMTDDNKQHSWFTAVLGAVSIPVIIYFLRVLGVIIGKSAVYIKAHYTSLSDLSLIGFLVFAIFSATLFGYAKVEDHFSLNIVERYKNSGKLNRLFVCLGCLVVICVLLYNFLSIYVYFKHIGGSPLLTWEEFIDFRN